CRSLDSFCDPPELHSFPTRRSSDLPNGRVAILTFHSGEDRRVKQAFRSGYRAGVYAEVATAVIRSSKAETFANGRASAAKLRWRSEEHTSELQSQSNLLCRLPLENK